MSGDIVNVGDEFNSHRTRTCTFARLLEFAHKEISENLQTRAKQGFGSNVSTALIKHG